MARGEGTPLRQLAEEFEVSERETEIRVATVSGRVPEIRARSVSGTSMTRLGSLFRRRRWQDGPLCAKLVVRPLVVPRRACCRVRDRGVRPSEGARQMEEVSCV
jgi:hypothetical protein